MNPLASLVVLVATAAAAAADDKPCCMPDKWHGKYILSVETTVSGNGKPDRTEIEMDMTYDATKQRVASIVNTTDSKGNVQQILQLGFYSDKVEYNYNLKDKSCVKKDVAAFPARCLPGNSKVVDSPVVLGMCDNKVTGKLWSYYISSPAMSVDARTVVTDTNCIPIFGYELRTMKGPPETYQLIASFYKDVEEGLGSEDIFTLPAACQ